MTKEYGFDWNGVSCKEYGVTLESKEIPLVPKRRVIEKKLPGIDGTINFDTGKSESITIKAKCYFKDRTIERLQQFKWNIKQWLHTGEGMISFHDEYDKFYIGILKNQIPLENLLTLGRFTLIWACKPFAYSKHLSNERLSFNAPWALGAGYRLDMQSAVWQVTGASSKQVYNWGIEKIRPIIQVTGACSSISFTCNGTAMSYNAALSGETLIIDCQNKTAKIGSNSVLSDLSITPNEWDAIELNTGNNVFDITGTSLDCEVSVMFRGKY